MRKYYVVAGKTPDPDIIEIKVTDNKNGYNVLLEIEAKDYNEALSRVRFTKSVNGGSRSI